MSGVLSTDLRQTGAAFASGTGDAHHGPGRHLAPKLVRFGRTAVSAVVVLLIFRAYLAPNTVPRWLDQWRDVHLHYFGLGGARGAGAAALALATLAFGSYYPISSRRQGPFGLWLATGAWLSLTAAVILAPSSPDSVVLREGCLLLGYACGLAAARLLPRIEGYLLALVACGLLQSVIAITYRIMGLDRFVSGDVIRAGGSFGTPAMLFLVPVFVLPLAVQGVLAAPTTGARTFTMVATAALLAALMLTWERSGVAAGLAAMLWLVSRRVPARRRWVGWIMALGVLLVVFLVRGTGPVNAASSARSVKGRAELMKAGALAFGHHWFEGVGVGRLSLPVQIEIAGRPTNVSLIDPHNQALFWLAEMGIVGALLIAGLAWFVCRTLRDSQSPWADGVAAVWVSVACAGMFNTLFGLSDFSCGNMLIGSLLGLTMRVGAACDEPRQTTT